MKITLAGKEFDVPTLVIAQLREIDWRIMSVSPALADRSKMTRQSRDYLFDIAYVAVSQTTTRDEFDALGATLLDVMKAMPVIIKQSNLYKPAAEATPQTGEALPPTGTQS